MADHYVSGNWQVAEGKEEEFVERWTEFLEWTRASQTGFGSATLVRSVQEPRHFVSFAEWEDPGARDSWRQTPEFMAKFGACRELCDDFAGGDFERTVTI